jgi:glucokinase
VNPGPSTCVVAIDVGGTTLKGAVVTSDGCVPVRLDAPTPAADGGDAVARAVVRLARDLAAAAPDQRVVGVAAVTAGHVDTASGTVRYAANLGWKDLPLGPMLGQALGVPAAVDHDARGAGLAEAVYGGQGAVVPAGSHRPARHSTDCLFVALGTGIGAALVRDGRVASGSTGAAGEVGHAPVYPDGEPCACGQRGCLEVYSSAAAVGRRYSAASGTAGRADEVVARLGHDPVADQVWGEAVEALAVALATCTLILDPGVVVLGGGLAKAGRALLDPLEARLTARLAWRPAPSVELAALDTDAGWLGASLKAWDAAGLDAPDRVALREVGR